MNIYARLLKILRVDIPAKGEVWHFKSDDPWGGHTVEILDTKKGWVRYSMGSPFDDERKSLGDFLFMYRRNAPDEP